MVGRVSEKPVLYGVGFELDVHCACEAEELLILGVEQAKETVLLDYTGMIDGTGVLLVALES